MATTSLSETSEARIRVVDGPSLHAQVGGPEILRTVVGVMTVAQLAPRYRIPRRDHTRKTGYQREVQQARVNRLQDDLRKGRVDLPTAVLLNLRGFDSAIHLVADSDGKSLWLGDNSQLYVVDGQHRTVALDNLFKEDPVKWGSFPVPFVCMLGASELQEMRQFYVVNANAKSVRTDLALDLLKQQAESDPNLHRSLVERGESWKVQAQALTEALEGHDLWRGKIRFPGDGPAGRTISSAGMVSSLRPLLATAFFAGIKQEQRLKVLAAFWEALKELMPEAFQQPQDFTLQKTVGVLPLHRVLVDIIERIRAKGDSPLDSDAYVRLLRDPLDKLEGDTRSGAIARGVDFWRSGSEGAAGSYTSQAGQRVLVAKIVHLLPDIEVE